MALSLHQECPLIEFSYKEKILYMLDQYELHDWQVSYYMASIVAS